jgi:hypothetical protein
VLRIHNFMRIMLRLRVRLRKQRNLNKFKYAEDALTK